jgi:hypothetical protein
MGLARISAVIGVAWVALGFLRMPIEAGLAKELESKRLTGPTLEIGTRDKIGQTSSAVALGGLRTLVATFLNLRAFTFFTGQKWQDVAHTYEMIVDLAPRTRYYWDTGSWHQAYNAASYYLNDSALPALRRREAWRASIFDGKAFLERGLRNNPEDWRLWANLGFLLADPNKFPAFPDQEACFRQAAEAYRKAAESGDALGYVKRSQLYAMARIPEWETEALAIAQELFAEGGQNRAPTLLCLLFVLESRHQPPPDPVARAVEIFGSEEAAHQNLGRFWGRTRERYPVYGVSSALEALERSLSIPAEKSVLNQLPAVPWNPYDMFAR